MPYQKSGNELDTGRYVDSQILHCRYRIWTTKTRAAVCRSLGTMRILVLNTYCQCRYLKCESRDLDPLRAATRIRCPFLGVDKSEELAYALSLARAYVIVEIQHAANNTVNL